MCRHFGLVAGRPLYVRTVGVQLPRLPVVGQAGAQQRAQALLQQAILHRDDDLHPPFQIARHPVG